MKISNTWIFIRSAFVVKNNHLIFEASFKNASSDILQSITTNYYRFFLKSYRFLNNLDKQAFVL